ncbi:leucine-rich repeat-containing protein 74A-like [Liolophura sinensis]|uniref:leucine-rich repeat-containing protein 74A-like n=1 Tax=Liolophura sinensis TaxID=3198878 RepID=UPI0031587E5D
MAEPTVPKLAVGITTRNYSETVGNSGALASKRLQLQKRHTLPVIRNPGTTRERTMLVPERKLSRTLEKQKDVKRLSPLSDCNFDLDAWNFEDDELDSAKPTCFSCQNVYLSACRRASVVTSRQLWRQLHKSSVLLDHHQIGPLGTKALAVALVYNSTITSLELRECHIQPEGLQYLLEALEENSFVSILKVPGNHLKSAGARMIGRFLKTNKSLRILDVGENDFEDQDARYFAEGLQENQGLEELGLSKNRFREQGGVLLEKALARNSSLLKVDLSWNHLRHIGSVAIARFLESNTMVKTLNLAWNGFGLDGCYQMAKSLKLNKTLIELDLSSNRINFDAFSLLLNGLSHNITLEVLRIGQNPITCDGAAAILQTLLHQPTYGIQELDLYDISVDQRFLSALKDLQTQRPVKVTHGHIVSGLDPQMSLGPEVMNTDDPLLLLFEYTKGRNLRLIDLFKSLDKDKSETITRGEFRNGLKSVGLTLSNQSLDVLMQRLDLNRDGHVDFEELLVGQKDYARKAAKRRQRGEVDMTAALSELLKDKLRMRSGTSWRQSVTGKQI